MIIEYLFGCFHILDSSIGVGIIIDMGIGSEIGKVVIVYIIRIVK
jgi:hypothetical protein